MEETKKILIVDDDFLIRELVGEEISLLYPNYEIKKAINGEEGEKKIDEYIPDIILTDLNMPVKNGAYVIIKAKEKNIPVILMSDFKEQGSYEEANKKLNPTYILIKPFDALQLKKAIETVFNPSKGLEGNI